MRRFLGALLLTACAAPARVAAPAKPVQVEVPRIVVTSTETMTLAEMFAAGRAAAERSDFEKAASLFDRVVALEPHGELAGEALFLAAEARGLHGDQAGALERYEAVVDRYPEHARARDAAVRAVRILAYREEWDWAGRYADRALEHATELQPLQLVAAYGGKALQSVSAGDDKRASVYVERGRDVVERNGLDLAGRLPSELAPLYFALGEVYRERSERVQLEPTAEFPALLETRCQAILDAQRAYSDTWRAYDSFWSTLAGFRLAEMYEKLHVDVMAMGPPPTADTDALRALYEGGMRLRYSVLLEKARGMMEHTVAMAERTGEHTAWVERAREALRSISEAEAVEQASLDRLPYSRADLEDAFTELRKKAKERPRARAVP
ncbi:MAG TPA: tetratricopeptide repeat protein [Polyangiaceae bacterium]|nr:tetratricopeptide repeat protein [Polyangiaceae bacterium]